MRSWSRLGMRKGVDRMSPVAIPIRTVCPARRPASRKRHGLSLATAFFYLDYFFFFQAEDGIRDPLVTGVQTCALPISIDVGRQLFVDDFLIERTTLRRTVHAANYHPENPILKPDKSWEQSGRDSAAMEIGRASCRERV